MKRQEKDEKFQCVLFSDFVLRITETTTRFTQQAKIKECRCCKKQRLLNNKRFRFKTATKTDSMIDWSRPLAEYHEDFAKFEEVFRKQKMFVRIFLNLFVQR